MTHRLINHMLHLRKLLLNATFLIALLCGLSPMHAQVVVGPSNFVVGPSDTQQYVADESPQAEQGATQRVIMAPLTNRAASFDKSSPKNQQSGQKQAQSSFGQTKSEQTATSLNTTQSASPTAMQRSNRAQNGKTLLPILSLLLDDDTTAETVRTVGEFDFFSTTACCKFGIGGFTLGDFNGDGLMDALFAGRATQPTTQAEWINSRVQVILQKPGGGFEIATDALIAAGQDIVEGTEPPVVVADFNGDGKDDFFISGGTDSDYIVPSYLYLSSPTGAHVRQTVHTNTWNHHAIKADIDGDGTPEILVTGYSNQLHVIKVVNGQHQITQADGVASGGSSLAAGRFLSAGGLQVIRSDVGSANPRDDLQLFDTSFNVNNRFELSYVSTLPTSSLYLWPGLITTGASHEYRIHATDFNQDGLDDLIVLSSPPPGYNSPFHITEMDFLQNQDHGVFVSVTPQVRLNYDNRVGPNYDLKFLDIDGDGCQDMFYDGLDFEGTGSKLFLMNDCQGRFTAKGKAKLLQLIQDMTRGLRLNYPAGSTNMTLVPGPQGQMQILYAVYVQAETGFKVKLLSATVHKDILQ
jgi:hypothetical protein